MTLMAGNSSVQPNGSSAQKRCVRSSSASWLLGVLVNGISQLVHMLQCERGASNVWLCSQGKLYAPNAKPAGRWWMKISPYCMAFWINTPQCRAAPYVSASPLRCRALNHSAPCEKVNQQTVTAPQAMEHYCRMLSPSAQHRAAAQRQH